MEKYETVGPRFAALFIDGILISFFGFAVSLITALFPLSSKIAFISSSAAGVAAVFYYILLHARYGQTVGKKVMNLKVLDITERPITFAQAVIRSLPQMFPIFIGAGLVNTASRQNPDHDAIEIAGILISTVSWMWQITNIIVCLASEKKRALHDLIAGTVVVKTSNSNSL